MNHLGYILMNPAHEDFWHLPKEMMGQFSTLTQSNPTNAKYFLVLRKLNTS